MSSTRVRFFIRVYTKNGKLLGYTPISFTTHRHSKARIKSSTQKSYNEYSRLVEQGKVKRDKYGRFKGF